VTRAWLLGFVLVLVSRHALAAGSSEASSAGEAEDDHVAISFVTGMGDDSFLVTVDNLSCRTPCTLQLKPGQYDLTREHALGPPRRLTVPKWSGVVRVQAAAENLQIPGIVLTVAGFLAGAGGWTLGFACPRNEVAPSCGLTMIILWPVVGGLAFVTGVGFLIRAATYLDPEPVVNMAGPATPPDNGFHLRLVAMGLQPVQHGVAGGVAFSF
jgi:hypothetical protein